MNGEEDTQMDESDSSDNQGEQKLKGGKTLVLLQDFEGYCIYRGASSFVVYKPKNVFAGYFTTFGACIRQVYECMLIDKAMNRENHLKKNMDSLIEVIGDTKKQIKLLTTDLDKITFSMLSEKRAKKGKVE